ncbi:type 3 dihydrofolate reductase [Bowmanella yangjiangensis]|uniref:Dihydrofolate reductase n=1 Tax=Bowmanella yangjiangensis TaxID=2811230 RepID=A0ABS3CQX0_9ALTE|nr:type 3 dihydrofolate reductase [Bowmanella yangjiangensis]MBN7819492.1 type 3 dihydrofolate reductase [Bowmanella yangjiangensis]
MQISMIAAMAKGRVIGKDNQMPWHLPADLKHFKQVTLGKPVVMGRKTFESIGRPLPGRLNIVISRAEDFKPEGVTVVTSPEQAIAAAQDSATNELMIIGGGAIYRHFLPQCHRLYITDIELVVDGDTTFPDYQAVADWQEVAVQQVSPDESNAYAMTFRTLERV